MIKNHVHSNISPTLARRATAIIELTDGVLVAARAGERFNLPGGNAQRGELRSQALIRELRDNTGLRVHSMLYLFDHLTPHTIHKVYLVLCQGVPKPQAEVTRLGIIVSPDSELDLANESRSILRRYARIRSKEGPKGDALRSLLRLARYIAKVEQPENLNLF